MLSQPDKLRALLKEDRLHVMPCCFDALSARMIAQAGFEISFMSGFAVSAARIGAPDTGLISYGEMLDQGRNICAAVDIPVIGDGDTGYGNALNVRRTVEGYARAGFAAVMIEDQVMPKRCGHTRGKTVVDRAEAFERVRAAIDARNEGTDILILARTDARATDGLAEAIARGQAFAELGADILFVESPRSDKEMRQICAEIPGVHMANLLEGGDTPILPPDALKEMGYRLAAFPLTLISAAMKGMADALNALKAGRQAENILDFAQLRKTVGFNAYYDLEARYARGRDGAAEFKKR